MQTVYAGYQECVGISLLSLTGLPRGNAVRYIILVNSLLYCAFKLFMLLLGRMKIHTSESYPPYFIRLFGC